MKKPILKKWDGTTTGKTKAIQSIGLVFTLFAFMGAFFLAYSHHKVENALSTVPRADLMPDQQPKTRTSPPTQVSKTPIPTHSVDKKTQGKAELGSTVKATKIPNSTTINNSPNGSDTNNSDGPTINTQSNSNANNNLHSIDYSKVKTKNGLVSGEDIAKYINSHKGTINGDGVDSTKVYSVSPNKVAGVSTLIKDINAKNSPNGVMTFLLMGSDSRDVSKDRGRSDSLMMAYVNRSHSKIYLISFPRDLYVKIPGYARQKINAAYSKGGAPLTVQTINNFTGINMQHAAIVNFNSFVNLVDTVGGVTVYNEYTGCDKMQHLCWTKGPLNLKSFSALHYVRWRHGLPNGDVDRARNQQKVVKAIIAKAATPSMIANPNKLSDFIVKAGKNVVVDRSLTNDAILKDALSMRITSGDDIRTITAPIVGYYMDPIYGSVDLVNGPRMQELRNALASDNLDSYWNKYKNAPVAGPATEYNTNNW